MNMNSRGGGTAVFMITMMNGSLRVDGRRLLGTVTRIAVNAWR